jgi:ribose-phosphate pyrophosphokinase
MGHRPLSLFGLEGSRELAGLVAQRLEIALAPHEERNFEDGEHKARPLQEVRGHDVFVLHSLYGDDHESGHDKLCRLLFFCGALKDSGAAHVTAITPYLCYARKDRRTKPNDPVITRYVAALFEAIGIDRIVVCEVHNGAAFENAFRCPAWHIESAPLLAAHFAPLLHGESAVAVSPDAGGARRAEQFRQALQQRTRQDVGSAIMEKHRSSGVVTGDLLAGDIKGKAAIIVDDMISTGGTLVRAANACRSAGATKVYAAATHGLFIDGAPELFAAPALDGIVVANTIPPFRVAPDNAARRLTVLDATASIAEIISVCHDGS